MWSVSKLYLLIVPISVFSMCEARFVCWLPLIFKHKISEYMDRGKMLSAKVE